MKILKYVLSMVAVIFLFAAFCKTTAFATDYTITVGLYYGSTALGSCEVSSDGGFVVTYGGQSYSGGGTLTVSIKDGGLSVGDLGIAYGGEVRLKPNGGIFYINGNGYRGSLVLKLSEGSITAINEVDVEEYLYSVVPSEMPSDWDMQALMAQAVCARTYTLKNLNKHSKYGFDLCSTIDCQVYRGIKSEASRTTQAVISTKGEYVTYDMKPISVFYFSCDGGHTESAVNVWGNDLPYLVGVEDPYENPMTPNYVWTKEVSPEEVSRIMNSRGHNIGNVIDIAVTKRSDMGGVVELTVTGTGGVRVFKGEECRTFLGTAGPNSQNYIVDKAEGGVLSSTSGLIDVSNMYIKAAEGDPEKFYGSTLALISTRIYERNVSASFADNFVFVGSGYGHLVGMSQYGAKSMGELGYDYRQILQHYFTGTQILK